MIVKTLKGCFDSLCRFREYFLLDTTLYKMKTVLKDFIISSNQKFVLSAAGQFI